MALSLLAMTTPNPLLEEEGVAAIPVPAVREGSVPEEHSISLAFSKLGSLGLPGAEGLHGKSIKTTRNGIVLIIAP